MRLPPFDFRLKSPDQSSAGQVEPGAETTRFETMCRHFFSPAAAQRNPQRPQKLHASNRNSAESRDRLMFLDLPGRLLSVAG
jgi:hypothetical protein